MTPAHVGERVSIRRWVDDPARGPVPSDVVGRLVGWDGDVLRVQRRDGVVVEIDAGSILASRPIPAHPRLPPEGGA